MYSKEFWVTGHKYHLGARYLLCLSMIRYLLCLSMIRFVKRFHKFHRSYTINA